MYIKSLAARNIEEGWELKEVEFDYNFTLLVGVSGAGKTQILRSISNLQDIIDGRVVNGFEWAINIELPNGECYKWEGAFSSRRDDQTTHIINGEEQSSNGALQGGQPVLVREQLVDGADNKIVDRNKEETLFNGTKVPRLPKHTSTLAIFEEEPQIVHLKTILDRIVFRDNTERTKPIHAPLSFEEVLTKIKVNKLAELKEYTLPNIIKFLLAIRNEIPVFETIIHSFIEVFPEVKKVGAATDIYGTSATYTVEMILNEDDTGVPQVKMSSGMLRFLMLLIDLHLSPDGSIFLIDEIENSLGINCLDEYVHQLQHANPNIQIIATSHHPYIINNIPYQQWKVVKRKGAVISVMDAEDLGIGQSRQEAFIQLNKVLKK